jgi:hypothetical protein
MSDEPPLILDGDYKQIGSERFIEVPLSGPGDANSLVMLNGIAFTGSDDPGRGLDRIEGDSHWAVFIDTKYRLADADPWPNIVNGSTTLLQATWVSLCAITADEEGGFVTALESATADWNSNKRIKLEIHAAVQGDCTILKIAYQVNFLIRKTVQTPRITPTARGVANP